MWVSREHRLLHGCELSSVFRTIAVPNEVLKQNADRKNHWHAAFGVKPLGLRLLDAWRNPYSSRKQLG